MKLKDIIDLDILLNRTRDQNSRRVFGLKCKKDPLKQILCWIKEANLKDGDSFERELNRVSSILFTLSLILGFLTGYGLLKFTINEYVNIVYILLFAVFIPFILSIISLIYIFKESKSSILPLNIVQKLISFFTKSDKEYNIDSNLLYAYNLKTASLASFLFSVGLLLAIVAVGIGKDIPFGWSTTLNISSEAFYWLIDIISKPFAFIINNIPTLDTVEASRHFSGVAKSIKSDNLAAIHASWWIFLIAATIFYGLFFRAIIYLLANLKYKKTLKNTILNYNGVYELLKDFNTPTITTHSNKQETLQQPINSTLKSVEKSVNYDALLGWAIDSNKLLLIKDNLSINCNTLYTVGGLKPIESDLEVINTLSNKDVAIFVNSYEVPTLDFLDFLEDLSIKASSIYLLFNNAKKRDIEIWSAKVSTLNKSNIFIKVYNDS